MRNSLYVHADRMRIKSGDRTEAERRNNIGTMVESVISLYKKRKNLFDAHAGGATVPDNARPQSAPAPALTRRRRAPSWASYMRCDSL
ncbi:hypothetical protein EVAR_13528_1 [Eumeta japonica]|uniref:Uncharacterized protein n=1 Tax=Eumeta variegata TaxID=151549 RepID=A0A4C1U8X6_EUMVA|nr:hypothetical protein EVAR_13528_1 [Eumeta japonica]